MNDHDQDFLIAQSYWIIQINRSTILYEIIWFIQYSWWLIGILRETCLHTALVQMFKIYLGAAFPAL